MMTPSSNSLSFACGKTAMALLLFSLVWAPSLCGAQTKAVIDTSVTAAISDFDRLDPRHAALLANAAGALIFPHLIKGGIALSNEFGEGVLQIQGKTVGYYSLTSVSVGLTAGMESHSAIVLFMTQPALDAFRRSRGWSVGAENSVALLTRGASGDYDSNTLRKPILGFVFAEQGLMADASIESAKITKLKK
jgi:lipid-binding SYLF domain-containing protein